MKITMKLYLLVSFLFFSLVSCGNDKIHPEEDSGNLDFAYIMLKSEGMETAAALEVKDGKVLTNIQPLPESANLTASVLSFKLKSETAVLKLDETVLESGVTVVDLSGSMVLTVEGKGGARREFSVVLTKQSDIPSLTLISLADDTEKECPLFINDGTVSNMSALPGGINLKSVVFNYEISLSGYSLFTMDGKEVESGVTSVDATSEVLVALKASASDETLAEYTIKLIDSRNGINIRVYPSSVKHPYVGGGTSFAKYIGNVNNLTESEYDRFFRTMYGEVNMRYVQYYCPGRPSDYRENFDNIYRYFKEVRKHNDKIGFVYVTSKIPDDLCIDKEVNGETIKIMDIDREDIYIQIAQYMLDLMNDLYERCDGYTIEIISVANEPDFDKSWIWGKKDSGEGLGLMVQGAIPALRKLLKDPVANPHSLSCPKIMAPATISPNGCLTYLKSWQQNYTEGWNSVDIMATHQYSTKYGCDDETFKSIRALGNGRLFYQTEMHANKGDGWGDDFLASAPKVRAVISLGKLFASSVRSGVSSWFYFLANTTNSGTIPALLYTPANGNSFSTTKHYYAFKQLHNLQPYDNTYVIDFSGAPDDLQTVSFIVTGEDKIVVHMSNSSNEKRSVNVNLGSIVPEKMVLWETSASSEMQKKQEQILDSDIIHSVSFTVEPYSLTSVEVYF